MIRLKNIFLAQALAFSAIAFGQGTFASNLPQTYDNRPTSNVKDFSSSEKLNFKKYQNAIYFWSFTNGTVFGDKVQDEFLETVKYGSLGFSIDAATPETYIKVRKLN